MIKKIVAALMAMFILGGLAYYSGILYSEKAGMLEQAHLRAPIAIFLQAQLSEQEIVAKNRRQLHEEEDLTRLEVSTQGDMVLAEAETYLYYLMEESGYVNIYLADGKTIYEYTNITLDMLPSDLQSEILVGKGMASEGELYDFLENYSS